VDWLKEQFKKKRRGVQTKNEWAVQIKGHSVDTGKKRLLFPGIVSNNSGLLHLASPSLALLCIFERV